MQRKPLSSLLAVVRTPVSLVLVVGFSILFFDLQYFIMSRLPGSANEMCVMGAGLNSANIIFSILLSVLFGLFVSGIITLFQMKSTSAGGATFSGVGALIGILTIFCPSCTFSTISFFGIGLGFFAFTEYNTLFKILSLVFMLIGLYQLNKQLEGSCARCV